MTVRYDRARDEIVMTDANGSSVRYSPGAWVNIVTAVTLLLVDRAKYARPRLVADDFSTDEPTPVVTKPGKRPPR